ncbi:MAG: BTAD domain-containing putative transcriptional regulator, partial [Acidimicrobiales bacterium]
LALGDAETVLASMEELVDEHRYHEPFWAHYITALYQLGRQAEALSVYSELRQLLEDELGIAPSAELQQLESAVLRHEPALAAPVLTPNNLPAEVSSLVGRDAQITEVGYLLDSSRLVTLTGSGGVGKTRLGVAVARDCLERYPDGVWLIDLAPLDSRELVMSAGAAAVNREPLLPRRSDDVLVEAMGPLRMLFVLDNCEHLVYAAAATAALIVRRTPLVDVLVTSREILQLQGETVWRVPSLPVPDDASTDTVDAESVMLFVARAQAANASFLLDSSNVDAVASICRHLDGIPLAIELAAARARTLSTQELDRRLGETMDVLAGGSREVLPRHRTLRATVEWSYYQLSPPARAFFDSLGVFAAGFTNEAASAVTGLDGSETADIIEELVSKSVLTPMGGAEVRFRLLETLRHFALERLAATDRLNAARHAHLDWMLGFCSREASKFWKGERTAAVAKLRAADDDVRAAVRWSLDSGRADVGLPMADAVARAFYYLGVTCAEPRPGANHSRARCDVIDAPWRCGGVLRG